MIIHTLKYTSGCERGSSYSCSCELNEVKKWQSQKTCFGYFFFWLETSDSKKNKKNLFHIKKKTFLQTMERTKYKEQESLHKLSLTKDIEMKKKNYLWSCAFPEVVLKKSKLESDDNSDTHSTTSNSAYIVQLFTSKYMKNHASSRNSP